MLKNRDIVDKIHGEDDGTGRFLVTDGDRQLLGTKYGVEVYADVGNSAEAKKTAYHIDPNENTAYLTLYKKGDNSVAQTELTLKDNKRAYINGKTVLVAEYDPNVTHIEITDDATIKNYVTYPSSFGSGVTMKTLLVNVMRFGDVCMLNGRLFVNDMTLDTEDDSAQVVTINIMEFIKDQGWFDADILVAGYGNVSVLNILSSSDFKIQNELLYTRDRNHSTVPNSMSFYNSEALIGKNDTIETKRYWFNVAFTVEDK